MTSETPFFYVPSQRAGKAEKQPGLSPNIPLMRLSSNSDCWSGPHHITGKPYSTQTISLQLIAVKGMEEELRSNKEMFAKCSFTNTASAVLQLSACYGCLLVGMRVMPWSVKGREICHLILPRVAAVALVPQPLVAVLLILC